MEISKDDRLSYKKIKTVHILGLPRTGTTILYQCLAEHGKLAYFYHKTWLPVSLRKLVNIRSFTPFEGSQWRKFHHELEYLETPASEEEKRYYRNSVKIFCKKFKTNYFLSKYPSNVLRIKWLNSIFPEGKYIILHRDKIASLQSLFHFAEKNLARDQQHAISYEHGFEGWVTILNQFGNGELNYETIKKYHDFMKNNQIKDSKLLKNKIDVKYEDFTENPEDVLKRIYSFIGLSWDNSIKLPEISNLNFRHERKSSSKK